MFTQVCRINLSVKLAREPRQSVKLTMKLSGCFCHNVHRRETWIECEFVAKVLIEYAVVAKFRI